VWFLSAEKEIVNFWLNRKSFFTISNLKTKNKDVGLLALKFDKQNLKRIVHVEVICSITGFSDKNNIFEKIVFEKFGDKNVVNAISKYTKNIDPDVKIEKVIVLNSLPKNREGIMKKLTEGSIVVFEFEDILADVMKELKTEYFKDDVIRTLQIMKFLLLSNPKKFVSVLFDNLSQAKVREFLSEMLDREDVIKDFKRTNEERLAMILKQSMIKPEKLAEMLENDVLNRRTRKPFISSLMEHKKIGREYKKRLKVKKELTLNKFFE